MFKIMQDKLPCSVQSVPMSYVLKYQEQLFRNHSQSVERLNERGGLSSRELYCAVNNVSVWRIISGSLKEETANEWLESLKF